MWLGQNIKLTRILIKTHHMTSVKKIEKITKAAKKLDCAVLLKTGRPPGVMLAEGEVGKAEEWLDVVKVGSKVCLEALKVHGIAVQLLWLAVKRCYERPILDNAVEIRMNG